MFCATCSVLKYKTQMKFNVTIHMASEYCAYVWLSEGLHMLFWRQS